MYVCMYGMHACSCRWKGREYRRKTDSERCEQEEGGRENERLAAKAEGLRKGEVFKAPQEAAREL